MAKKGLALLAVAAVAAFVIAKGTKKKSSPEVDDKRPGEDDWGVPDTHEMVDSGAYVGYSAQAEWRIYEDPEEYFTFEWRGEDGKDGGGSGFPSQQEAGDALWQELQGEYGPESHPETGEPPIMPEDERPPEGGESEDEGPPPSPTSATKDDWGISTTATLVDYGSYEGSKANAEWRIYLHSNGTFFYVFRSPIIGGSKRDFATQDDAGNALFDHMERKLDTNAGSSTEPGGRVGP